MTEKYVLVCISHGGKVSSSTYDSRYAADNARSIALTGMTLEAVAERRRFHENARKEWEKSHPWRKPETAQHEPESVRLRNFFFTVPHQQMGSIVTNPPYGKGGRLAVQFIKHALELTSERGGKVAMLLRVDFDSAATRSHIFGDHPAFDAKYTLTKRIRWANLEQKASGPTENHAWFVWNWARRMGDRPFYGYLPTTQEHAS